MPMPHSDLLRRRAELEIWGRSLADRAPRMDGERADVIEAGGLQISVVTVSSAAAAGAVPHVFVHGGAWCMGSAQTFLGLLRRMSAQCRRPILSVGYPLAPEHPYPAAIDAVAAALERIAAGRGLAGVIAGSAGCHLALGALVRLREAGRPVRPEAMLLWNPAISQHCRSWSHAAFGGRFQPTSASLAEAMALYAVPHDDPLADADSLPLADMPAAWIACGDRDPLLDDSVRLFRRLTEHGVAAHLAVVPGAVHGFMNRWLDDRAAEDAVTRALDWLEAQCGSRTVEPGPSRA
jgi:acetyl esterase